MVPLFVVPMVSMLTLLIRLLGTLKVLFWLHSAADPADCPTSAFTVHRPPLTMKTIGRLYSLVTPQALQIRFRPEVLLLKQAKAMWLPFRHPLVNVSLVFSGIRVFMTLRLLQKRCLPENTRTELFPFSEQFFLWLASLVTMLCVLTL